MKKTSKPAARRRAHASEELSWTSPDVPAETNFGRGGEGKLKLEVVSSKAVAESH